MKTKYSIIKLSVALALVFASCQPPVEPIPDPTPVPVPAPHWQTVIPTVSEAPAWALADDAIDQTSTMNVIFAPAEALSEGDLLAAFVGDVCVGLAAPVMKEKAFYLTVFHPLVSGRIALRYYSATSHSILYYPECFSYVNDELLGTPKHPFEPEVVPSYYTLEARLLYSFPDSTKFDYNDEIALFVDGVCRMLIPVEPYLSPGTPLEARVPMVKTEEQMVFRYYSATEKRIYSAPLTLRTAVPTAALPLTLKAE